MKSFIDFYLILKSLKYQKTFYFFFNLFFIYTFRNINIGKILFLFILITKKNFLKSHPAIYDK